MIYPENVRKAAAADLPEVVRLFAGAIRRMDENGIPQWDEIYPDEAILAEDIAAGNMYVYIIGGRIAAVFVLNREFDPEYVKGDWRYPNSDFAVVHRLCVSTDFQHMGVAASAMRAAEAILKNGGVESIRLDAFPRNPYAIKLYEKLGYVKTGECDFRKGRFYLYEKKI